MNGWTVKLTSAAVGNLDGVPARVLPAVIEFIHGPLADDPARVGKPLSGDFHGLLGARRGDYRVMYEVNEGDSTVVVHRIAHGSKAYRRL